MEPERPERQPSVDDAGLDIPLSAVSPHVSCAVCLGDLREATTTPCGHNFCSECVAECVDRHRKCPLCQAPVAAEQLARNRQMDALVASVAAARAAAPGVHAAGLLDGAGVSAADLVGQVYVERTRKTLAEYRAFALAVDADFERQLARPGADADDLARRRARSAELLARSLEEHLAASAPAPALVPVRCAVVCGALRAEASLRAPLPLGEQALAALRRAAEAAGDPIASVAEGSLEIDVVPPEGGAGRAADPAAAVLGLRLAPGSTVVVRAALERASAVPPRCFTAEFEAGKGQRVDYFRCADCGINWVCRACSETCHRGHAVVPYLARHAPSYACCYCPKKRKCVLENRLSGGGGRR